MKILKEENGIQYEAQRKAYNYLLQGFNCSQSILLTMQELLGLRDELTLKAATGFAGGIGNMGSLCGALAGGVMVIGLKYGRSKLEEEALKEKTYTLCAEWYKRFKNNFGSSNCYDILKVDLSNPRKRKEYWAIRENREKCARMVGMVAKMLMGFIEEEEKNSYKSP